MDSTLYAFEEKLRTNLLDVSSTEELRLVIAVSGGSDSLSLLFALDNLSESLNLSIFGAHINHGVRGSDSLADSKFVEKIFKKLEIPFMIGKGESYIEEGSHSNVSENFLRNERFEFLTKALKKFDAHFIALGHTSDDQVETVLMNLIRGTGIKGLEGISKKNERIIKGDKIFLIRPLLNFTKAETVDYCKKIGIVPRIDSTNSSLSYTRNRIREDLIPKIQREYNPQFRSAVLRLIDVAKKNNQYMGNVVNQYWDSIADNYDGVWVINKEKYCSLDRILRDQLLLKAVISIQGHTLGVEQKHLDIFANFLQKQFDGEVPFYTGLKIIITSEYILIGTPSLMSQYPKFPGEKYILRFNQKNILGDWIVEAKQIMKEDQVDIKLNTYRQDDKSYKYSPISLDYWPDGLSVYCNFDQVGNKLWVRTRKCGDVFNPLGISKNKTLKKFMIDSKIQKIWRDSIPLVESPRGIVWVVGWRIANWAKVKREGENWVKLQFSPRLDIRERITASEKNDCN